MADWLDTPIVKDAMYHATVVVSELSGNQYQRRVRERLSPSDLDGETEHVHVESPLEATFIVWWTALDWFRRPLKFILRPQQEITCGDKRYRADFVIDVYEAAARQAASIGHPWIPIVVELDGHEFHEKTKEQIIYRNQRDRALQQHGSRVFHISYEEMQRAGLDSVIEIYSAAEDQLTQIVIALDKLGLKLQSRD